MAEPVPSDEGPDEPADGTADGGPGAAERVEALLRRLLAQAAPVVEADVARTAAANPGLDRASLARLLVRRGVRRTGAVSAVTALPGGPAAALNVSSVTALQVALVYAVAVAHDRHRDPTLTRDLLVVLAGERGARLLAGLGVDVPAEPTREWVDREVDARGVADVRRLLAPVVLRWVRGRVTTGVARAVPLAGAALAYGADRAATRAVGERALRYYGG